MAHGRHGGHEGHAAHAGGHAGHHAHMVADFRRRFWVSLVLTIPVVILSPMIQDVFGLREALRFPGDSYVQFGFATIIFFYGGWPFLKGLFEELGQREPGMMTLIGLAISVAYVYSSAVVFGLTGAVFFWELATLIDVMLLGHWIEMRSVMGASRALESLVQLMPAEAHRVTASGAHGGRTRQRLAARRPRGRQAGREGPDRRPDRRRPHQPEPGHAHGRKPAGGEGRGR